MQRLGTSAGGSTAEVAVTSFYCKSDMGLSAGSRGIACGSSGSSVQSFMEQLCSVENSCISDPKRRALSRRKKQR